MSDSSIISWIKSEKFRVSPFPFYSLEISAKFCGCVCVTALGSVAAPPLASDEDTYTCWSLVTGFHLCSIPCLCAWAHDSPQLFHAALAISEASSQPLSVISTTPSETMNIFVGSPLGIWRFKLSGPFLPGMAQLPSRLCCWWFAEHLCFTQEASQRTSLLLKPS